VFNRAGQLRS